MQSLTLTNSITRRDEKSLEKYFTEISKYEVLTPEEESALFNRLNRGDDRVSSKIVLHNLRFVVSVAKKYQHTGLWLGDLINEGNIGLIKAVHRFDVTRGFKFISYAVWWIRQTIIKAINEKGRKIRLPSNYQLNSSIILQAKIRFFQENEREPAISELAHETGLKPEVIQKFLGNYKKCRSLDAPLSVESETSLSNLMEDNSIEKPDFKLTGPDSQKQEVAHLLGKLPPREAMVLTQLYGIEGNGPMSLTEIGDQIGISKERVRQIKTRGLRRLRLRHPRKMATG